MEADNIKVVCPHCDAVNAIPPDRPAQAAKCGKCHKALFNGSPVDLAAALHVEGHGDIGTVDRLFAAPTIGDAAGNVRRALRTLLWLTPLGPCGALAWCPLRLQLLIGTKAPLDGHQSEQPRLGQ